VTGEARANGLTLRVRSGLPYRGDNAVEVFGEAPVEKGLSFRVPDWAGSYDLKVNGEALAPALESGYMTVRRTWKAGDRIELNFDLPVRMKYCRYEVDANRGRLALTRGPLVYCLEEVDNGPNLDAVSLPADGTFEPAEHPEMPEGILALTGAGIREHARTDSLYADEPPAKHEIRVTAVPYYAWNNRGPGEMLVWIRRAS
jgi:DUF1680 family protein